VEQEKPTYASSGVSLETADAIVERLRSAAESTGAHGFGAFAGLYEIGGGKSLVASTDSVGTKLIVARKRGALRNCGMDLAAHCINDVLTSGAEPLFFLDYVAANKIELDPIVQLVEGAAEVCRDAGCMLLGGETAELPGIYRELDFAGTCVGLVERDRLIDGSRVEAGDVVVGFASSGVHANGFSLVRRVLAEEDYDGADMLAPTRLYLRHVHALRARTDVRALANVTGGGILGNLNRVIPEGLRLRIQWDAWERPPVFNWLARHVAEEELRRVFNLGIGYCAVVPEPVYGLVIGRIERA